MLIFYNCLVYFWKGHSRPLRPWQCGRLAMSRGMAHPVFRALSTFLKVGLLTILNCTRFNCLAAPWHFRIGWLWSMSWHQQIGKRYVYLQCKRAKSSSGLLINYVIFNFTIPFTFKIMMAQYFFYFFISVKSPYILVLLLILIDSYIQIKSFVLQENGSSSA